jgi:hypothetical protein
MPPGFTVVGNCHDSPHGRNWKLPTTPTLTPRLQQQLDEYAYRISEDNLKNTGSSCATQIRRRLWFKRKLQLIWRYSSVSDWKMKILACFFENQAKWFGKRYLPVLAPWLYQIQQIQLLEQEVWKKCSCNDVHRRHQTGWSLCSLCQNIYRHHLPAHVIRSSFRTDGAGCFQVPTTEAFKPWATWTGESLTRVTQPAIRIISWWNVR